MNNIQNNRYDEMKSLLQKSRMLFEQAGQINVATDLENNLEQSSGEYETAPNTDNDAEEAQEEKVQKYRISGGILALHGKDRSELEITTDEKTAFQESMDEFIEEVSDLVDFNALNVYKNNVEWSGRVIDEDLEFIFTIGEDSGIYINGDMVRVDPDFLETINKLQQYYQKFKSRWGRIIAIRKKTHERPR
jgi:hypothetical protein